MGMFHYGTIAFVTFFVLHSFAEERCSPGAKEKMSTTQCAAAMAGAGIAVDGGIVAGHYYSRPDAIRDSDWHDAFVRTRGAATAKEIESTTASFKPNDRVIISVDPTDEQLLAYEIERHRQLVLDNRHLSIETQQKIMDAEHVGDKAAIARLREDMSDYNLSADRYEHEMIEMQNGRVKPPRSPIRFMVDGSSTTSADALKIVQENIGGGGKITRIRVLSAEKIAAVASRSRGIARGAVGMTVGLGIVAEEMIAGKIGDAISSPLNYVPQRATPGAK